MVDIASKYAKEHKIEFSTDPKPEKSKTKGMVFSRIPLNFSPAPIILNGDALPWVSEAKYLGGKLTGILDGRKMHESRGLVILKESVNSCRNSPWLTLR